MVLLRFCFEGLLYHRTVTREAPLHEVDRLRRTCVMRATACESVGGVDERLVELIWIGLVLISLVVEEVGRRGVEHVGEQIAELQNSQTIEE
jgi:hypothetical protein